MSKVYFFLGYWKCSSCWAIDCAHLCLVNSELATAMEGLRSADN